MSSRFLSAPVRRAEKFDDQDGEEPCENRLVLVHVRSQGAQ